MHSLFFKEIHRILIRNLASEIVLQKKHNKKTLFPNKLMGTESKKTKKEQKNTQQFSSTSHERTINNSTKNKKNIENMICTPCPHPPPTQTLTKMNHSPNLPILSLFAVTLSLLTLYHFLYVELLFHSLLIWLLVQKQNFVINLH